MKAVLLCAGMGTRLGSLTTNIPKAMLPIGGRPLIDYSLRYLQTHGFSDVAINVHYFADSITSFVGDGSRYGIRVHYSHEKALLGTAGTLRSLRDYLRNESAFLVMYGDVLTDQDLMPLIRFHEEKHRSVATLLLHRRAGTNSRVLIDNQNRITSFIERPANEEVGENLSWANSGLHIVSRGLLELIPDVDPVDLPRDVFSQIYKTSPIYGFPIDGFRCAIDSPERYAEASRAVTSGEYRQ